MAAIFKEYRFSRVEYKLLCQLARGGSELKFKSRIESVPAEDRARFGPTTFCPPVHYRLESFLAIACSQGQLNIVKYLLENFGDIINVNSMGWFRVQGISKLTTPLIAACYHQDIVQYLISKGADINKADLEGNTALHHVNCIELVEHLVNNGADINKVNYRGVSPIVEIVSRLNITREKCIKILKYLLDKGAVQQNGYSVLHEVRDLVVLQFLFDYGVSPMFTTTSNSTDIDYIPCPLYSYACCDNDEIVELFLHRSDCPIECKINTYLLQGVSNRISLNIKCFDKAFQLMKEHNVSLTYPPPVAEYGFRTEIKGIEELDAIKDSPLEVFYQWILINERCRGREGRVDALKRIIWQQKFKFIDILSAVIDRAIQLEEMWIHQQILSQQGPPTICPKFDILTDIFNVSNSTNYPLHVKYCLTLLKALRHLSLPITDREIVRILSIFVKWIEACTSSYPSLMISLAEEFVSEFLHYPDGSNLLFAGLYSFNRCPPLLELVLEAGAGVVVNDIVVTSNREYTFLNAVLKFCAYSKILKILLEYGAHIDITTSEGLTIFSEAFNNIVPSSFKSLHSLRSLYCLSANAIVHHSLPYEGLLPPHVTHFVRLHDPSYFKSLEYFD